MHDVITMPDIEDPERNRAFLNSLPSISPNFISTGSSGVRKTDFSKAILLLQAQQAKKHWRCEWAQKLRSQDTKNRLPRGFKPVKPRITVEGPIEIAFRELQSTSHI